MSSTHKPVPLALVICDNIYQESTGKRALVGLFNRIISPSVPFLHSRMNLYVALTDTRPGTHGKIELVHLETGEVLFTAEGPIPFDEDPTAIIEIQLDMKPVFFKQIGLHMVKFFANDHPLLERPIVVSLPPKQPVEESK